LVLGYDRIIGTKEYATVVMRTMHHTTDFTTIEVGGRVLRGASGHKVFTLEKSESRLLAELAVALKDKREVKTTPEVTYDLVLDRHHNFYTNNVLVESIAPRP